MKQERGAVRAPSQPRAAVAVTTETIQTQTYSGPLPHPSILKDYELIQPGFAERIFKLAEGEAAHRRELESKQVQANVDALKLRGSERIRGQWFGFLIGTIAIVSGSYVTIAGQSASSQIGGAVIGGGGVVGLVSVFILGRTTSANGKSETKKTS